MAIMFLRSASMVPEEFDVLAIIGLLVKKLPSLLLILFDYYDDMNFPSYLYDWLSSFALELILWN